MPGCNGDPDDPAGAAEQSEKLKKQRDAKIAEARAKLAAAKAPLPEELTPEFKQRVADAVASFKPGLYQHYKGNAYVALCLVTHHETRLPMVLYISLVYGSTNVRPLIGWPGDEDGFIDSPPLLQRPRFHYVGLLPSDIPVLKRL